MSDNSPRDTLTELDKRLRKARGEPETADQQSGADGSARGAIGNALRVSIELVSGVAVGVILGLALDEWLGTSPWGFLGMFFLGAIAGFWNVYRWARGMGSSLGFRGQHDGDAEHDSADDR